MSKFKKGESGNPAGKPRGCLSQSGRLREAISADLPQILAVLRDRALDGDVQAATVLLSRCLPALRPASAAVAIPGAGNGLAERAEAIAAATMAGELPPDAAADFMAVMSAHSRIQEVAELEARISALEEKQNEKN